ncbi:biopolymer transport protein ExbD [Sphingomonas insulae]|uniref:Biopolymer transporter ExbD n=1 Tax=Sphingomonas insulae TaxID=424800 RepID=A0ABP3T0G6_9SPHN|nr:biopolymer transporter ExbD [Sphingomonas insulae]NIJ28355.1 biopolymer transport protein ExbD [Sphingomonas insulae]
MPRKRAFSPATGPAFDAPLSDLNITPLIDVMLVLLVMMILTLPTVLHEVPVDLPQGYAPPSETVTHPLVLARDGGVTRDGVVLSDAAMPARFKALDADRKALLVMRTDPEARYERFDQVLSEVKRAGITRLGFAENEALVE